MLHHETVYPKTLGLLRLLMQNKELSDFNLAGGTSLSLQIGHRLSYDLDLFGTSTLTTEEIFEIVQPFSPQLLSQSKNILILNIDDIKVDFVKYRYAPITPISIYETNLRLLDLPDIAAMKLAAIVGRGRKRDFTDIYFLLQHFTIQEMMGFYTQKYPDGNAFLVLRSLTYFEDADQDESLNLLIQVDWSVIKITILNAVKTLS
jgi:Nucleotidyl transferase AbiEii toxin, Type IV TA system